MFNQGIRSYMHITFLYFLMLIFNADVFASQTRETVLLSDGWKFLFSAKQVPNEVSKSDFNDELWQTVSVPHSWNQVGYYTNTFPHLNDLKNVNKEQGIGWYRLKFKSPSVKKNQLAWLEFDAASRTAEVWLNGVRLGEHRGGFTRFRFNASQAILSGGNNVLTVKTDNTKPTATSSTADTLPIAGDFFVHGGLYRPVRLILTETVHFDMLDYGGPGVYATSDLSDDLTSANIAVRANLSNATNTNHNLMLSAQLIDKQGKVVASDTQEINLVKTQTSRHSQTLNLNNPKLWQGVTHPYLYKLRVTLKNADAEIIDMIEQNIGLRKIAFDANRGLLLNNQALKIKGVAYHQDREGKGWAVDAADIQQDMQQLVDMGANSIRLAHYPHGQPIHDLADQYGLILWDEIPLVTSWTYGKAHPSTNLALLENASLQLTEMIRQNFNHPSVAMWGIANEVDFGAVVPAFLGATAGEVPSPLPILQTLASQVAKEDPSRVSTLANCCEAREQLSKVDIPKTSPIADVVGLNRYYGWYYGQPQALSAHLDKLHSEYPDLPVSVSEYGAGGALSLHTDNPLGGPVDATGHFQPEEYMSYVHEENWRVLNSKEYLFATWIWNAFDFATTARREGDAIDINTKGLVSYDRAIKKDSYFFYQANWSKLATLHITGRRYKERAYPVSDVRIYSNAIETELFVNGISQGVKTDCPQQTCIWDNIRLTTGDNRILASGMINDQQVSDEIIWTLPVGNANNYHVDSGALVASSTDTNSYGSDHFFSGGTAKSLDTPGSWGRPAVIVPIEKTQNRLAAATYREGEFSYHFQLDNGDYNLTLYFVEPNKNPGERHFNVNINGSPMLENFDIAEQAGAAKTEIFREQKVHVVDGNLIVNFIPVSEKAIVSAMTIEPLQ